MKSGCVGYDTAVLFWHDVVIVPYDELYIVGCDAYIVPKKTNFENVYI